jgi:hypothetical protein
MENPRLTDVDQSSVADYLKVWLVNPAKTPRI